LVVPHRVKTNKIGELLIQFIHLHSYKKQNLMLVYILDFTSPH